MPTILREAMDLEEEVISHLREHGECDMGALRQVGALRLGWAAAFDCASSPNIVLGSHSNTSSLQNERFVGDFLQKSHVKSPRRAFRTRLAQKLTCQSLQNERFVRDFLQKSSGNTHRSTHITQPCQAVSRFLPLQTTPAHTPIPM